MAGSLRRQVPSGRSESRSAFLSRGASPRRISGQRPFPRASFLLRHCPVYGLSLSLPSALDRRDSALSGHRSRYEQARRSDPARFMKSNADRPIGVGMPCRTTSRVASGSLTTVCCPTGGARDRLAPPQAKRGDVIRKHSNILGAFQHEPGVVARHSSRHPTRKKAGSPRSTSC